MQCNAISIFNSVHLTHEFNVLLHYYSHYTGYLFLQNTAFSGKLPPTFPPGLVELDIANSLITGSLDGAAFENLSSLRFLLMDGVQFDSSIPSEIASLPNLEYFFAIDAMITGDLSYMESMPVIFEHWVDRNPQLGGQIPSFLGSLTTLQSFSIADCGFTGTIPESLGNLGLMQQMWLYKNQLSGEVPASMGRLSFMRIFEVEGNNLSDSMPESICENFSTGMLEVLGADCDKLDVSFGSSSSSVVVVVIIVIASSKFSFHSSSRSTLSNFFRCSYFPLSLVPVLHVLLHGRVPRRELG